MHKNKFIRLQQTEWSKKLEGTKIFRIVLVKLIHNETTPYAVYTEIQHNENWKQQFSDSVDFNEGDYIFRLEEVWKTWRDRVNRYINFFENPDRIDVSETIPK